MIPAPLFVKDRFFNQARDLRNEFDRVYRDPRHADPKRFVWDWWNVPGKYTHLRTPAWEYFSKRRFESFANHLVDFGRSVLGCHGITPPWLSLYVEGCEQHLHADVPHGPWAFVYSLSGPGTLQFGGGDTQLLDESVLSYFEDFPRRLGQGIEKEHLTLSVRPQFNRLVVFDPRIPHGVSRVSGVKDAQEGRLVIHGWFNNPRPFAEGKIDRRTFQKIVERLGSIVGGLMKSIEVHGVACFRIEGATAKNGKPQIDLLASTLRGIGSDAGLDARAIEQGLEIQIREDLSAMLPPGRYRLTIPVQCTP